MKWSFKIRLVVHPRASPNRLLLVNIICKDCLACCATTCMIGVQPWVIEKLNKHMEEIVVQNDMNIRSCPNVLRWSLFTILDHCSGLFATLGYSDEYLMNGTLGWFGLACSLSRNTGGLCANNWQQVSKGSISMVGLLSKSGYRYLNQYGAGSNLQAWLNAFWCVLTCCYQFCFWLIDLQRTSCAFINLDRSLRGIWNILKLRWADSKLSDHQPWKRHQDEYSK